MTDTSKSFAQAVREMGDCGLASDCVFATNCAGHFVCLRGGQTYHDQGQCDEYEPYCPVCKEENR